MLRNLDPKILNYLNSKKQILPDMSELVKYLALKSNSSIVNIDLAELNHKQNTDMSNSIVVCTINTSNNHRISSAFYELKKLSEKCNYLLISIPYSNLIAKKIESILKKTNFQNYLKGITISDNLLNEKSSVLIASGKYLFPKHIANKKILAFMQVYNEIDIAIYTIINLLNQNIDVLVFDNWSDDGTFEKLIELKKKYSKLRVIRFPNKNVNKEFRLIPFLQNATKMISRLPYDWFIYQGSDEILESPWPGMNLRKGIEMVDAIGYNAIDHTVLEFRMTDDKYTIDKNPENHFKYFEFGKNPGHFLQISSWKKIENTEFNLTQSAGHEVIFSNRMVFPVKFLKKHYSLRSEKQATKKIISRINRSNIKEINGGLHTHYFKLLKLLRNKKNMIWTKSFLLKFDKVKFYSEYFIERISGIGLKTNNSITINSANRLKQLEEELSQIHNSKLYTFWIIYNKIKRFLTV